MATTHTFIAHDLRNRTHGKTLVARGTFSMTTPIDGVGVAGYVFQEIATAGNLQHLELLNGRMWLNSTDPGTGVYTVQVFYRHAAPLAFDTILAASAAITDVHRTNVYIPMATVVNDGADLDETGTGLPTGDGANVSNEQLAFVLGSTDPSSNIEIRVNETTALVATITLEYLIHLNFAEMGASAPLTLTSDVTVT